MLGALRLVRVIALFVCALWLGAMARAEQSTAAKNSPPSVIYHNYCSVCHGDRGDGQSRARGSLNPPPRDFTTAQALSELTRDRMIAAVKGGVPGTAMVGYVSQLNPKQIEALVDYVRNTFMRASTNADASRGRQVYAKTCSVCHGDRGAGSQWAQANLNPPPRDFTTPQARGDLTRDRMLAAVAGGRPGTAMASFSSQLKPADMEAVVDYIRTAFMRVDSDAGISGTQAHGGAPVLPNAPVAKAAPAKPVKVDMSAPLPNGLVGNVEAGRKFYDANCATCHGVKGDGQGPRAYFINPKPRVLISAETRAMFNRPALFAGVSAGRNGSEMPAWDKVLTPQEIANVTEYVFQAFIQGAANKVAKKNP
jgi:cbb3-type cytochrome c oxidase subunit III